MSGAPSCLPLRARGLCFEADGARLIDGVDLEVARGARLALIGPNGAGKTLTLRLLAGLVKPCSGSLEWAAVDPGAAGRRRDALVFQKPVMLRRSALGNLCHALAAIGVPREARVGRARASLVRFGLEELAERPARVLSGGEQQRLSIARAACLEPELMLLDEPTASLDPAAARSVEAMFGELAASGVTLVFSTHNLGQARRLATELIFLHRGRVIERGPTERIFERPRAPQTKAFLAGEFIS